MSLIAFLVIGLVAGLIARAVMPGNQSLGLLATTALGIVGSFVGGMLGSLLNSGGNYLAIGPSGLIFSIIGAMAVLALVGFAGGGRRAV
ncbi:MAG: hypothetical protein H6Q89_5353 [Myxococcaceae bacterium]|nr:hypothetical protein [Myxococcaceae bacterium]